MSNNQIEALKAELDARIAEIDSIQAQLSAVSQELLKKKKSVAWKRKSGNARQYSDTGFEIKRSIVSAFGKIEQTLELIYSEKSADTELGKIYTAILGHHEYKIGTTFSCTARQRDETGVYKKLHCFEIISDTKYGDNGWEYLIKEVEFSQNLSAVELLYFEDRSQVV
jgi:hypothetical protein